jgi:hypothetical protein
MRTGILPTVSSLTSVNAAGLSQARGELRRQRG